MSQTVTRSNTWQPAADPELGLLREEDKNAYREILQHLKDDNCALFVGSGPSIPLVRSWSDLIEDLGKEAGIPRQQHESKFKFAERCRKKLAKLDKDRYGRFLYDRFSLCRKSDPFRAIHTKMIDTNFAAFVTTNYDTCLENAAGCGTNENYAKICKTLAWPHDQMTARFLGDRGRALYYIHGRIHKEDNPGNIRVILTALDYKDAYKNDSYLGFLTELIVTSGLTVLFCGYGFGDHPMLLKTLLKAHSAFKKQLKNQSAQTKTPPRPRHYILTGVEGKEADDGTILCRPEQIEKAVVPLKERLSSLRPEIEFVPVLYADPWPNKPGQEHFFLTQMFERMSSQTPYRETGRALQTQGVVL